MEHIHNLIVDDSSSGETEKNDNSSQIFSDSTLHLPAHQLLHVKIDDFF